MVWLINSAAPCLVLTGFPFWLRTLSAVIFDTVSLNQISYLLVLHTMGFINGGTSRNTSAVRVLTTGELYLANIRWQLGDNGNRRWAQQWCRKHMYWGFWAFHSVMLCSTLALSIRMLGHENTLCRMPVESHKQAINNINLDIQNRQTSWQPDGGRKNGRGGSSYSILDVSGWKGKEGSTKHFERKDKACFYDSGTG